VTYFHIHEDQNYKEYKGTGRWNRCWNQYFL